MRTYNTNTRETAPKKKSPPPKKKMKEKGYRFSATANNAYEVLETSEYVPLVPARLDRIGRSQIYQEPKIWRKFAKAEP